MKTRNLRMVLVFVLALCFALLTHAEVVADGEIAFFDWTLDSNGVLSITGDSGDADGGIIVTNAPWWRYNSQVKELVIGDEAGDLLCVSLSVFNDLVNLEKITVGEGNTDFCSEDGILFTKDKNGILKFPHNMNVTSYTLPETVEFVAEYAFYGNVNLQEIVFNNSISQIQDYSFSACKSLKTISVPDSVDYLGDYAFSDCESLTYAKLPVGVTKVSNGIFEGCVKLETIDIPDTVTEFGEAIFSACRGLTQIKIHEGVTRISDRMFDGCTKLEKVELPSSLKSIGYFGFGSCESLKGISLPEGLETIGWLAFPYCTGLTEVVIPSSVTVIGESAFSGCSNLERIIADNNSVYYVENGVLFDKNDGILLKYLNKNPMTSYTVPDSIKMIGSDSFSHCTNLKEVILPDGVEYIGIAAFEGCTSLEKIHIPGSVTMIDYAAFEGCDNITFVCPFNSEARSRAAGSGIPWIASDDAKLCPSNVKVLVDGKETTFTAYNIDGNNYFKIRDIACALNGSAKQFDVSWDAEKKLVSAVMGAAYEAVGGELAIEENSLAKAVAYANSDVLLKVGDRESRMFMTAYNIGGNNYFKLRALGVMVNFAVGWDETTKTITIDTSKGYYDYYYE